MDAVADRGLSMRRRWVAAGAVLSLGLVGGGAAALADGEDVVASCTSAPKVQDVETGSRITVVCTVPRPPAVTETVTVPGPTETVTVTAEPKPEPTPTVVPSSTAPTVEPSKSPDPTPTQTPTETPSPTVTPTVPAGYPDASNTGAKGTLTVVNGGRTISTPGAVVSNTEFRGSVTITAANVTLRNVRIVDNGYWPLWVKAPGALLEDVTVKAGSNSQAALAGSFTGRRLDLSGAGDGVKMASNSVLEDSFVHDLADFDGAHNDGVDADNATNIRVVHNTILNQVGQTSALMLSDYGSNPDTKVLVQGNLFAGGGYTIYGGAPDTAAGHQVVDNVFSTRFFPRSGYLGPLAYWRSTGNTWARNTWLDGPNAGKTINP